MSGRTEKRVNVFLSSRLPDSPEDRLRQLRKQVLEYAEKRLKLTVWDPSRKPRGTPAQEILNECLHYLSQADLYICILENTYGTNQKDLGALSILELEIFHAVLSRKTPYFFAIEPFDPSEYLRTLLDSLEVIYPNLIQCCSHDQAFSRIKKILWGYRLLWRSRLFRQCANFLTPFAPHSFMRWAGIHLRGEIDLSSLFLQSRFAPFGFRTIPEKDTINQLIAKAAATDLQPTKLVLLWAAIRHLSSARYDDRQSADFLPLWNKVLSGWASAAAWSGFHGPYLSLGRLPAVNTLLRLREHAAESHVTFRGQLNGSLASEYYSLAKRARSRRRRRELLEEAITQVQFGLKTNPASSGLLLIQGSIHLARGEIGEAVTAYEAAVMHREKSGASPGALGEAQAELGFAYLRQGRMSEAQACLETGVAKLKVSEKGPGFKVRAMRKLAVYYLSTWQLRLAILQFAEAYKLALEKGIHGQITKPMLVSHWIWKVVFRKGMYKCL